MYNPPKHFTYNRTVYFSDTDAAGVVYFTKGLSMCHEAYENALATLGIDLKTFFSHSAEIVMPIVHAEIDFFRPLFCGDRLSIELKAEKISDSELEMTYLIVRESLQIAKAKTKHVAINLQTRQRISLPEIVTQGLFRA